MEHDADAETVREVYERAIANVPPIQEKRHWKRYIYLWINYALYEELEVKVGLLALPSSSSSCETRVELCVNNVNIFYQDAERTGQVYQACLELIPHKKVQYNLPFPFS